MVHDADGEHKVKGFGQQWQLFQVCLKEADIGQLLAERGGFIDGAGVICGGDMSACGAAEQCIATAPAAGIKDMEVELWQGMVAAAATPKPIMDRIEAAAAYMPMATPPRLMANPYK